MVGWSRVVDAVHDAGGTIVIQLMHVGRISHPSNTVHGRLPVGPSRVIPKATIFTNQGMKEIPSPRPLAIDEIRATIDDFRIAASHAIGAGADGVEIHAGNGYLIHQFLSSNANQRSDDYGGSVANHLRFAIEVVRAVSHEVGAERVGVHISPGNALNDIVENQPKELYAGLLRGLEEQHLAYLNVVHGGDEEVVGLVRRSWNGTFFLNRRGADLSVRVEDIKSGLADAITVGRETLANPDLVTRVKRGLPLNDLDLGTLYGGSAKGYTDYPTWD
jgi:N-ethylmaleimide reductase